MVPFAVTLSHTATAQVTVDYTTRDGSPQAASDYTAKSGTLTCQAGESSKTIEVAVLDDSHDEGEETFTLALSLGAREKPARIDAKDLCNSSRSGRRKSGGSSIPLRRRHLDEDRAGLPVPGGDCPPRAAGRQHGVVDLLSPGPAVAPRRGGRRGKDGKGGE